MKKSGKGFLLVVLVIVVVLNISLFTNILGGSVTSRTDVNNIADVKLKANVLGVLGVIESGEIIPATSWDGSVKTALYVIITMNDRSVELPDATRIDLIVGGSIILSRAMNDISYSSWDGVYSTMFDLGVIEQGSHDAFFRFSGFIEGTRDGTVILVGDSIHFILENGAVADPNPILLSNLPVDITVEPFSTTEISWSYRYSGDLSISIIDNEKGISTVSVGPSLVVTEYKYSYYAEVSGEHVLTAKFLPMDGSPNPMASDSLNVLVKVGGDVPDFPPSVDRVDISVTQEIVGEGATNIFITGWYSDVAVKGAYNTIIDGVLDVEVAVEPKGAFLTMKVIIADSEYFLDKTTGWTHDVFSKSIDTDEIVAGLHTVEFWGFDSDIATWYKVGSFTVSIRVDSTPFDPLITLGIIVTIVGVAVVIVIIRKRK